VSEKKGILNLLGIGNIIDQLKALVETRMQIIKLEIKEELSKSFAKALIGLVLIFILFIALLFLSIAISIYLGYILDNYFYGFLLTSGFYFLLFIILYLLRNKIGFREYFEKELSKLLSVEK
jgi:uncharacterized membrane protein YqjE